MCVSTDCSLFSTCWYSGFVEINKYSKKCCKWIIELIILCENALKLLCTLFSSKDIPLFMSMRWNLSFYHWQKEVDFFLESRIRYTHGRHKSFCLVVKWEYLGRNSFKFTSHFLYELASDWKSYWNAAVSFTLSALKDLIFAG